MTSSDVVTSLRRHGVGEKLPASSTASVFCIPQQSECCDDKRQHNNSMEVVVSENRSVDLGLSTEGRFGSTGSAVRFLCGGYSMQHIAKGGAAGSNADAFLLSRRMVGVADGVSAVEAEGFNPALLPKELLKECFALAQSRNDNVSQFKSDTKKLLSEMNANPLPTIPIPNAKRLPNRYNDENDFIKFILARAFGHCSQMGSTTCCLAIIQGRTLYVVNVGDSQMVVLRPKQCVDGRKPQITVVGKTLTQQHFFNCPYQLTRMPDVDCEPQELARRCLEVADVTKYDLEVGDIIVGGTDGLFDNLFLETSIVPEVAEYVSRGTLSSHVSFSLAKRLVNMALDKSTPTVFDWDASRSSEAIDTPFSRALSTEFRRTVKGGKPDDTTALVAFIVASDDPALRTEKIRAQHDARSHPVRPVRRPPDTSDDRRSNDRMTSTNSSTQFSADPTLGSVKSKSRSVSRLFSRRLSHMAHKSHSRHDVEQSVMVTPRFKNAPQVQAAPPCEPEETSLSRRLSRQHTVLESRFEGDGVDEEIFDTQDLWPAEGKNCGFLIEAEVCGPMLRCSCVLCKARIGCRNCRPSIDCSNSPWKYVPPSQISNTDKPSYDLSKNSTAKATPNKASAHSGRHDIQGESVRKKVEALEGSKRSDVGTRHRAPASRKRTMEIEDEESESSSSSCDPIWNTSSYAVPLVW